jgi:carboxymethylenebutenolidase
VRAFYGEQDERLITGLPEVKQRMSEAGVDFEATVYPGTGHAFFNDTNAHAYDAEAAGDAWRKVNTFFEETLGE